MNVKRMFPGGDPFLMKYDGKYYIYCTTENNDKFVSTESFHTDVDGKDGFFVYESEDMIKWENKGLCLSSQDVLGDKWFWAPEVSYYNGRFYMVYTANERLSIAVSDSPFGPFRQYSDGWLRDGMSIDGHLLFDESGIYLYYVAAGIFVAKMSNDLKRIEHEFPGHLILAEEPWETVDCHIAEGPCVIKHNGLYYLSYSCNHTRSKDYAVGYAVSVAPAGPFKKYEHNPILHRTADMVGVGHNSYMPAEKENKYICAYHCHNSDPDNFKPRMVCLCDAEFILENGVEVLKMYY